jgi:aspartate dehydrogenase
MTKTPTRGRRLGIVGCGAIGSLVARLLEKKKSSFRIAAVFDAEAARAGRLSQSLRSSPFVCANLNQLLSKCDVVLEAASVKAALPVAESALRRGKPIVLMSTGAFLLNRKRLTAMARKYRTKIHLPSGALCGLDGLKAARQMGKIKEITITSTKPSRGFEGAPGLTAAQKSSLYKSKTAFYLYQGDVWGAIRRFPANVNVAATTALASQEPEKLKVRVVADPRVKTNQHVIHVTGDFGELTAITRNVPSQANPKTSALAIQSALALFERLESYVEVGT